MGEAFKDGERLGSASGPSKADVLSQLERLHPEADEIRIRTERPASPEFQTDHTRAAAGEAKRKTLDEQLDEIFTYHAPTPEQLPRYGIIRDAARAFAHIIVDNTFPSADQSAAIRLLRECVMTANASIALEGKL